MVRIHQPHPLLICTFAAYTMSVEAILKVQRRCVIDARGVVPSIGGCARVGGRHPGCRRHAFEEELSQSLASSTATAPTPAPEPAPAPALTVTYHRHLRMRIKKGSA